MHENLGPPIYFFHVIRKDNIAFGRVKCNMQIVDCIFFTGHENCIASSDLNGKGRKYH